MNFPKAVISLSLLSLLAALYGTASIITGHALMAGVLAVLSAGVATFIGLARFL